MAIVIKKRVTSDPIVEPDPVIAPEHVATLTKKKAPRAGQHVLDGPCLAVTENSAKAAVSWFLMASYLYYVHDMSLLSDALYDKLAKQILAEFDTIEHQHKHLLTKADLEAGTLYALKAEDYPNIIKGAVQHVVRGNWRIGLDISWGKP